MRCRTTRCRTRRGGPGKLSDWRGRALAVTFVYTRCPLPDFCPLMDRRFGDAAARHPGRRRPAGSRAPGLGQLRSGARYAGRHSRRTPRRAAPIRRRGATSRDRRRRSIASRRDSACRRSTKRTTRRRSRTTCAPRSSIARGRLVKVHSGNDWTVETPARRSAPCRSSGAAFTARRARDHPPLPHARGGAGVSQPPALQHRTGARRRNAAQLPRRRPARHRALHGGGARRRGDPRAARLSPARFSASNRSTSSITCCSSTGTAAAGDRSAARAIPGCTGASRSSARARDLALSYVEPYIDYTGRVTGYTVVDLRTCSATTTGGCRTRTCGRRSGSCSTRRIARSSRQTRGSIGCGASTWRSGRRTTAGSRSTTRIGTLEAMPEGNW